MGTKPATPVRYQEDLVAWMDKTAQLLRERRFDEIDIENLADEVQSLAGRDTREVWSRLRVLLTHLLKWKHQPDRSALAKERDELELLFKDSPSLKRGLAAAVTQVYPDAVHIAAIETGLPRDAFPPKCPFTRKQILDRTYPPE